METSASASGPLGLPVAIIGGGATGLAAAFRLSKSGRQVRLFESGSRLGGAIRSERIDGWLVEAGPNSFQQNASEIVELLDELGLSSERVVANRFAKKRYIVRRGALCEVPSSPASLLATDLFSFSSKLRLVRELFRRPRRRTGDLSLADLIADHFGQEIVDYGLSPFVSGVYAGDPQKLSARRAFPSVWDAERERGSLIRGLARQAKDRRAAGHPKSQIISFPTGLQRLVEALSATLPAGSVELNARIEGLIPGNPWRIVWTKNGETVTEEFASVILAVPAASLAKLTFGSLGERPFASLEGIEYPPVSSLFLGFRRDQVNHPLDGFGGLVPAVEKRAILGVLFSSTLFPGRAPEGHVALTIMVGGALNPRLASASIDAIQDAAMQDLRPLLGITGAPTFRRLSTWPRAIAQYQLGYERYLDEISECEKKYAGLHIGGQVRDGISLPSCLLAGLRLARRAAVKA